MPDERFPDTVEGGPRVTVVPTGTVLWRVHHRDYGAHDFNPKPADSHWGGGRFDGTEQDSYPFLYAGYEESTAIAERLLRGQRFDGKPRMLARSVRQGRRLSPVETTLDLRLITLVSAVDLAAIYQDDWLVQADEPDYGKTRRWAHWLRQVDFGAQGLVWQSRRDRPNRALVLFGDRCPAAAVVTSSRYPGFDLDDDESLARLNVALAPYRACVDPCDGL